MPSRRALVYQSWTDLLFLHWRFGAAEVQASLPAGLYVETFDGAAWVGAVPFSLHGVRPRLCPRVPGLSAFLELNVRTYVHDARGRSGVWFYSLDCNQPLAVWLARRLFHLPYQHAWMSATSAGRTIHYRCRRRSDLDDARFEHTLAGASREAQAGSLEYFLIERYLLFAETPRGLRVGRVRHEPYPLADVALGEWSERPLTLAGFAAGGRPPDHAIGSPGVEVEVFGLTR